MADSEARSTAEDARLHAYLSKVVAAAGNSTVLTDEGMAIIQAFSTEHLSAALALYERYDADGDGRLQIDEFERMLCRLAPQHGARFSQAEIHRLFRSADLSGQGSLNVLEVLLLLQELALPPIAPDEADAYRERLMQTAARSVVALESEWPYCKRIRTRTKITSRSASAQPCLHPS